jgi:hypothetical protein
VGITKHQSHCLIFHLRFKVILGRDRPAVKWVIDGRRFSRVSFGAAAMDGRVSIDCASSLFYTTKYLKELRYQRIDIDIIVETPRFNTRTGFPPRSAHQTRSSLGEFRYESESMTAHSKRFDNCSYLFSLLFPTQICLSKRYFSSQLLLSLSPVLRWRMWLAWDESMIWYAYSKTDLVITRFPSTVSE